MTRATVTAVKLELLGLLRLAKSPEFLELLLADQNLESLGLPFNAQALLQRERSQHRNNIMQW
jgi:hypothetical protein